MLSPPDEAIAPERRKRRAGDLFIVWNRRLHYFLGLYLLFFCWLFVLTGLLLNHPRRWQFAQFWPKRIQSTTEHQFWLPQATNDTERARDLMRQFGISGEIQWPATQPATGPFVFQVSRPGLVIDVKADLNARRATLQRNDVNAWGVMHVLHTFIGVRAGDMHNERDWGLTTVWALSMDAVAAGLIVMVLSSYIMWYRLKAKRRAGIVALLLGFGSCGAFVAGFRWLL
jgi:hypothetical protein